LSCNKFSSNVIEKCIKASTPEVRQLLLDELTDPSTLPKLLTQSYANYVIQTALVVSDDNQFAQLRDAIQPLTYLLKNSPYGVKIESKIHKRNRELARKRESGNGGVGAGGGGGVGGAHRVRSHRREHPQYDARHGGSARNSHQQTSSAASVASGYGPAGPMPTTSTGLPGGYGPGYQPPTAEQLALMQQQQQQQQQQAYYQPQSVVQRGPHNPYAMAEPSAAGAMYSQAGWGPGAVGQDGSGYGPAQPVRNNPYGM
jgi:hypothetical protein